MRGSLRLEVRRGSRGKEGPDVLESCLWCVLDFFVGTCVIIPYPRRQSPIFFTPHDTNLMFPIGFFPGDLKAD